MPDRPSLSSAALRSRERLRRCYRPDCVRLLFIGEAPPASGRFFYQCDSGLYRAMQDAFRLVIPSMRDEDFLSTFRSAGCYLVDACGLPVDRLNRQSRRAACIAAEPALARRIRQLQPQSIAILLRSIERNVERAARLAGWTGPILALPYPGRWIHHRNAFLEALVPELRVLLATCRK